MYPPLIITAVPRSRSSLVTGIFEKCCLYLGKVCGPTAANKKGQLENTAIISNIEKKHLKDHGYDPKGQKLPLPPKDLPLDLTRQKETIKYFSPPTDKLWGFKDCKSILSYKSWLNAFPNSTWIIIHRDAHQIAKSCQKTSFMSAYNKKTDWLTWIYEYRKRFSWLKEETNNYYEIDSGKLIQFDFSEIMPVIEKVGLTWQEEKVKCWIDPSITFA